MSKRNRYQRINSMDDGTGERSQGKSNSVDGPGPLFDMHLNMAQAEDDNTVENWKAVANDSLIFSALFSAVVAAFLAISVQDLKPEPQDKPAFYLDNIYQLLANSSGTYTPVLHNQSDPFTFSPPKSAVWVNSLWFLSLVITLSCALLPLLLQQWTRRYIKLTQPRSAGSPHQRARIHAFFDKGVEDLRLQWIVDALPILLHASLVLFLAGLLIYTVGSNRTVFYVVVPWVGLCSLVYACFTLVPIIRHDSPYYTPLSSPVWLLYTGAQYVAAFILWRFTAFNPCNDEMWHHFDYLKDSYHTQYFHGLEWVAEECARKSSSEIDGWVLLWTLQSSLQDDELEQILARIPDFCNSSAFKDDLKRSIGEKIAGAVVGLMDRTLSSDLHSQPKQRRIMICSTAMAEASLLISLPTLDRVLHKDWSGLLYSVNFGLMLMQAHYSDPLAKYCSRCVVSIIVSRVQEHDDRWFELATGHLGISKDTLQTYLAHGDSMLLANCNFICRLTMEDYSKYGWRRSIHSRSKTLELVSRLAFRGTLPGLQYEFCEMWNELVRGAENQLSRKLSIYILKHIRNVYCGLHQSTDAAPRAFSSSTPDRASILLFPQSYPLCSVVRHPAIEEPSATPKPPSVRQAGVYNPSTPGSANVVIPYPIHAAPSSQAPPRLPGGIVAPPHSPDLRSPSQPNHSSLSRATPPIELLPLPATSTFHWQSNLNPFTSQEGYRTPAATSSRSPLRLTCRTELDFGTFAHKDPWTPISAIPITEVDAV